MGEIFLIDFYFLRNKNQDLAFFPETNKLLKINSDTKSLLEDLREKKSQEEICLKYDLTDGDYKSLVEKISGYAFAKKNHNQKQNANKKVNISGHEILELNKSNSLKRLTINVSNTCNLKCSYCYANGGNYGLKESIMTKDMARRIIDYFFGHFEKIDNILFFGGEPLLNVPVIKFICEYLHQKLDREEIKSVPYFYLITNGTIINQEIIDLIKKYEIYITVSFDGLPKINDAMRIFRDGSPTSELILKNMKELSEKTGQPNLVEITYNRVHEENNIKLKDINSFIKNNFREGIKYLTCSVISCDNKDNPYALKDISCILDSLDEIPLKDKSHDELLRSYYEAIAEPPNPICNAGYKMLAVSVTGDVYPCHMLVGNKNFCFGNINDGDTPILDAAKKFREKALSYDRKKDEKCKNCFARNTCFACFGNNYFQTGNIFKPDEQSCELHRGIIKKVLIKMSEEQE